MSSRTISAVMIPQGTHVVPEPMLIEASDTEVIQRVVDGLFDVVTVRVSYGENEECILVGYINDEGLLRPDMDLNYVATALFQRELYGNVLVVSGSHPETGVYDGESYDVPNWAYDGIRSDVVAETADAYNDAMAVAFALKFGPKMGIISEDDAITLRDKMYRVSKALTGECEMPDWTDADEDNVEYLKAWALFAMKAVEKRISEKEISDLEMFDKIIGNQFDSKDEE